MQLSFVTWGLQVFYDQVTAYFIPYIEIDLPEIFPHKPGIDHIILIQLRKIFWNLI